MTLPNYEDHEEEFLKVIATRFGFSGKTWLVFLERFREKNTDSLDKDVAVYLEAELIEGTNDGANPATILRDRLKAICDKFEAEGCDFQGVTKGRWKIAKRWLREVLYPEWLKQRYLIPLTCDQLWQQLWETATPTDKMKPLVKSLATLDMGGSEIEDDDKPSVPLGSRIYFQVHLEKAGYLLLLEKGTSGRIWCLSPSGGFAPNPYLPPGAASLPLLGARRKHFKLDDTGIEEVVAVIAKDKPLLDWLPQPSEPLLQLNEGHLKGLLVYLNHCPDCQVLRMAYRVTAT